MYIFAPNSTEILASFNDNRLGGIHPDRATVGKFGTDTNDVVRALSNAMVMRNKYAVDLQIYDTTQFHVGAEARKGFLSAFVSVFTLQKLGGTAVVRVDREALTESMDLIYLMSLYYEKMTIVCLDGNVFLTFEKLAHMIDEMILKRFIGGHIIRSNETGHRIGRQFYPVPEFFTRKIREVCICISCKKRYNNRTNHNNSQSTITSDVREYIRNMASNSTSRRIQSINASRSVQLSPKHTHRAAQI